MAGARAVHLHPTQFTENVVSDIRNRGLDVHAWDVNDEASLKLASALNIVKFSTDKLEKVLNFRNWEMGAKSA